MIESFRHKGLKLFYEKDDHRGINPEYRKKIRQILALMDVAEKIEDINYETYKLHPLMGNMKGFWAVTVKANWRIVFRFHAGKVSDVDLIDYH